MPGSNILLVEPNKKRIEYLSTLLLKAGYQIYHASSQRQALERLEKDKIDILIVSNSLPNTNLLELCKEIKSIKATKKIAIIIGFDSKDRAGRFFPLLETFIDGY